MPSYTRITEHLPGLYFQELGETFARAQKNTGGTRDKYLDLAGINVRLRVAGDTLLPRFGATLAHLEIEKPDRIDFTIRCWDDKESESNLPMPLAWMMTYHWYCCIMSLTDRRYRTFYIEWSGMLASIDVQECVAYCCYHDAEKLLMYEVSGPMRTLLSAILNSRDKHLIHAAAVGTARGSLLLAGPSGSGKSTLATLCLQDGLGYQADDLCAISGEDRPRSFCIYNITKLREDALPKFESFRRILSVFQEDEEKKAYFYVNEHFPDQVVKEAPIKALILPQISGESKSRLERVSPIEVFRGVIGWTLREIPRSDERGERIMLRAVSRFPAHRLHLGSDDRQTLDLIRGLLDEP